MSDAAETDFEEYQTTDLGFAAFLKVSGIDMVDTDRNTRGRVTFVFRYEDKILDLKRAWVTDAGYVLARKYADTLRELKGLCFA